MQFRADDGTELPFLVFESGDGAQPRAGIVLFHGGALRKGSAAGLAPHCRELASRGILAASAGYRLLGRGAVSIDECIADVRRAVERFGQLAASRGLDPRHLASGGSSAGAHIAMVAAMTSAASAPVPEPGIAALVALNPAGLNLRAFGPDVQRSLEQQIGIAAGSLIEYSLIEFVRPGNPPMQIHHGIADEVEPISFARQFRDAMVHSGNECTLLEYEQAEHGFHYPGNSGRFDDVIEAATGFLLGRIAMK